VRRLGRIGRLGVNGRRSAAKIAAPYHSRLRGWRLRELKARFNDGCVGIAVGDRLRACGSHRNQVAYPHEGMSRLRKRSGGGHMSWRRGKRCSSKGGIAWELYRHKTAAFSEGFKPSTAAPKRPPSGPQAAPKRPPSGPQAAHVVKYFRI
jgi:hypothetical protein